MIRSKSKSKATMPYDRVTRFAYGKISYDGEGFLPLIAALGFISKARVATFRSISRELSKPSMLSTNLFLAFPKFRLCAERVSLGSTEDRVLQWRAVETPSNGMLSVCILKKVRTRSVVN